MTKRPDWDHELNNGWNRWENLVLSELKRLGDVQDDIREAQQEMMVRVARTEDRGKAVSKTLEERAKMLDAVDRRVTTLETRGDQQKESRTRVRERIIAGSALMLSALGILAQWLGWIVPHHG